MSTKVDLADHQRVARAAVQAEWKAVRIPGMPADRPVFAAIDTDDGQGIADAYDGTRWSDAQCEANARHIAANSPRVTLALIDRIRELEVMLGSVALAASAAGATFEAGLAQATIAKGVVLP